MVLSTEGEIFRSYYSNNAPFYKQLFSTKRLKNGAITNEADCGVLCTEDSALIQGRPLNFSPDSEKLRSTSTNLEQYANRMATSSKKNAVKKKKKRMKKHTENNTMEGRGKIKKRRKSSKPPRKSRVKKRKLKKSKRRVRKRTIFE